MPALRILVVDDSVVIRQMTSQILAEDPELAIAGVAGDGKIALAKIDQVSPDLVTLDVEMPVMNGLETLAEIRKRQPKLPVIMFSTLTERGAGATIEALSLGASDYVTKPSNTMNQEEARQRIRAELIPKIKALCRAATILLLWPIGLTFAPPYRALPLLPSRGFKRWAREVASHSISTGRSRTKGSCRQGAGA